MKLLSYISLLYLILIFNQTAAQTLYVATWGNDSSNGSQTQPFQTIQKAQQVARTLVPSMSQDLTIIIQDGVYYFNQTLEFNATDSGINGYRVIYKAANSGQVEFNGGLNLSGFVIHDSNKNIYKTTIQSNLSVRNLFVNQVRAQRARSLDGTGWTTNQALKGYNCPAIVQSWGDLSELEIVVAEVWKHIRLPISTVSKYPHEQLHL